MNTDVFFTKGTSHKICQDYAVAGPDYIIVSDGCSGEQHTDFGSRLLTRAAIQHLSLYNMDYVAEGHIPTAFAQRTILSAAQSAQALFLDDRSLYATLLFAQVIDSRFMYAMIGDGAVVLKGKNGNLYVTKISFPKNPNGGTQPFYLRYCLSLESWNDYKVNVGLTYTVETYTILPSGEVTDQVVDNPKLTLNPGQPILYSRVVESELYKAVAIMSDGVFDFLVKDDAGAPPIHVISSAIMQEVMAFKGYQGEFVWRRMNRAFKLFEEKGWRPFDDFSMGVIAL